MLPTLVLVGRPNVGKSTLFNRLTKSRAALVADFPGLTRDRHYGRGRSGDRPFLIVDTGGFEPVAKDGILHEMAKQTRQAIAEADAVIFLTDARQGLSLQDKTIADLLRRSGRPVVLAVNKAEGLVVERAAADFYELGLGEPHPISSAHGDNVQAVVEHALSLVPADVGAGEERDADGRIKVAIVGRPNVGKSTLVNTLLGEERVIAFDQPGTTRDCDLPRLRAQRAPLHADRHRRRPAARQGVRGDREVLGGEDTAGDRGCQRRDPGARRARRRVRAGRAPGGLHPRGGPRAGAWASTSGTTSPAAQRDEVKRELDRKLGFLAFARQHFISAKEGRGVAGLLKSVDGAYAAAMAHLSTPRLTRSIIAAVERQQPPRTGMTRPKLRYAHQGGHNPPLVIIHGTGLGHIPDTYRRYLEHFLVDTFQLRGTPLRIQFKTGANPYAESPARRKGR